MLRARALMGASLAVVLGVMACGDPSQKSTNSGAAAEVAMPRPDKVAADVGNGYVSIDEFATAAGATPGADASMPLETRKEVLEQLLTDEVLLQEAVRQGLVRDPKVRKVLVNLLLRQEVYDKVSRQDFTDEELRAYYDAHREDFMVPEKIQIKRILVKFGEGSRTQDEAKKIIDGARAKVVKDPDSFRVVAEQVSEGSHNRRGGDLGFVPRSGKPGVDDLVAEKAFEMKMGVVSEPFEADGGYNIVLPVAKREANERTFSQMRGSVLRKLRSERFQELTDRYIDGLRGAATTTVHDDVIMAVDISARPVMPVRPGDGHGHSHDGDEGDEGDGTEDGEDVDEAPIRRPVPERKGKPPGAP
jgi:peptidyl-prolyl cis-trans isomerase C